MARLRDNLRDVRVVEERELHRGARKQEVAGEDAHLVTHVEVDLLVHHRPCAMRAAVRGDGRRRGRGFAQRELHERDA